MLGTHAAFGCIPTNTVSHQSHHILAFADTELRSAWADLRSQNFLDTPAVTSYQLPIGYVAQQTIGYTKRVFYSCSWELVQGRHDKLCMWQKTHPAYIYRKPPWRIWICCHLIFQRWHHITRQLTQIKGPYVDVRVKHQFHRSGYHPISTNGNQ